VIDSGKTHTLESLLPGPSKAAGKAQHGEALPLAWPLENCTDSGKLYTTLESHYQLKSWKPESSSIHHFSLIRDA
jgi:hypothetical protein